MVSRGHETALMRWSAQSEKLKMLILRMVSFIHFLIWKVVADIAVCRAGHGSEGNSILLGIVHPHNAPDHRLVRKLYATAQKNPSGT